MGVKVGFIFGAIFPNFERSYSSLFKNYVFFNTERFTLGGGVKIGVGNCAIKGGEKICPIIEIGMLPFFIILF